MKENKQENKKQEIKREKLTFEKVKEMLQLTAEEVAHATNLLAIGVTPAKIRDVFLKKRREEEKEIAKKEKEKKEKEEVAKQAIKKAESAKALYAELKNLPPFENFKKEILTIKNVSNYQNFKGKFWKVYGVDVEQDVPYIVTKEYSKDGKFDLVCYIPLEDVKLDYNRLLINDYEKDMCLPMEYIKVSE